MSSLWRRQPQYISILSIVCHFKFADHICWWGSNYWYLKVRYDSCDWRLTNLHCIKFKIKIKMEKTVLSGFHRRQIITCMEPARRQLVCNRLFLRHIISTLLLLMRHSFIFKTTTVATFRSIKISVTYNFFIFIYVLRRLLTYLIRPFSPILQDQLNQVHWAAIFSFHQSVKRPLSWP